jgi:hypothetical protein
MPLCACCRKNETTDYLRTPSGLEVPVCAACDDEHNRRETCGSDAMHPRPSTAYPTPRGVTCV